MANTLMKSTLSQLTYAVADAALHREPKIAWSLYGRGLVRLHKGLTAEGQADIAAASALEPKIAERAASYGIRP
jgi:hypothetical protein